MIKIKSTFTGTDSAGYINGTEYTILIGHAEQGCPINISAVGESFTGILSYTTLITFLADWNKIKSV